MDGEETVHDACRLSKTGEGTWLRTIAAAQLLKEHEVPFNILCVVTGANAARPKHTYEALRSYRFLQFIPCLEPLRGEGGYAPTCEAYAGFLDQTFALYKRDFLNNDYVSVRLFDNYVQMLIGMRPESCAMNGRCSVSFTIESDGSVYPCDFYCLDEWRLGSILENSFMELNNCARAAEFVNSSVRLHADCRACKYFSLCRGGCRRERACTQNGELLLNRYCAAYKHFFEKNYDGLLEIKDLALKSMRR